MAPFPKCLLFLIITTFLFILSALGLVSFHTKTHCWTTISDTINSKTTTDCPSNSNQICSQSHAFAVHYTETSSGLTIQTQLYCPWRSRTSILGLSALSLSQILLILALFTINRDSLRNPLIFSGFATILPLLATLGLMIVDLIDGFKYNKEYKTSEFFRPATYLANAILVFLSIFKLGFVVYSTIKPGRDPARRHAGRVASVSAVSFTTTKGGLNTSMSQVQYTGGESGILRENPVYSLPSASTIGRKARGNNKAFLNSSISQAQSGANSARTLITQRNEPSSRSPSTQVSARALIMQRNEAIGRNPPIQANARRGSTENIPSQPSTRREQSYINRSPRKNLELIVKGKPQSVSPTRSPGQQRQQLNSPIRGPIYLNLSENKPKVQRRNLSTSRHLTPMDQVLPIVNSPGKGSNHAENGRGRSMNWVP